MENNSITINALRSAYACVYVHTTVPCYSLEYAREVYGHKMCDTDFALAMDNHCYHVPSMGALWFTAAFALIGLYRIYRLCQRSDKGVSSYAWISLWVSVVYGWLITLLAMTSLFTDYVTPFGRAWEADGPLQFTWRASCGLLFLIVAFCYKWLILILFSVRGCVTLVEATEERGYSYETRDEATGRATMLNCMLATAGLSCCNSLFFYLYSHFVERTVRTQVIGVPSCLLPSSWNNWIRMSGLYIRVSFGMLTRSSPIIAAAEHEERFRHHIRKVLKFEREAAPCHDKTLHGHPGLAAERRGVHLGVVRPLLDKKYRLYDISTSRRTQRLGKGGAVDGYHGWFSHRDFMYGERNCAIENDHVLILIDVDYYLDVHQLASHMRPMILYTFNPGKVTGSTNESCWSTSYEDNEAVVTYCVNGGNDYVHRLWDYGSKDYVAFEQGGMTFTYAIERKRPFPESTHWVIFLQPCAVFNTRLMSEELRSSTHVVGRVTRPATATRRGDELYICDGDLEFVVKISLWQILLVSIRSQKHCSTHLTLQFIKQSGELVSGNPMYFAEWLTSKEKSGSLPECIVFGSVVERPGGDVFKNELIETHEIMQPQPTTAPAATPTKAVASDAGAVVTRISQIHNSTPWPQKYDQYVKDFLRGVGEATDTKPGALSPMSVDELLSKTERSKTRAKILGVCETALGSADLAACMVEGFVKREAYVKPGDERQISPTNDEHLAKMATYAYPMKEMLSKLPGYMPGKTPKEISAHIKVLFGMNKPMWETDFSRYDGQQSRSLRSIEVILFKHFFSDPAAAELVYNEIFNVEARCKAGSYSTGGNLCSGSALTTIMNTFKHMLVQYITYREAGYTHEEAMAAILAAYGDDGILIGEKEVAESMKTVCDTVGLKNLKCQPAMTETRPYVTFVGRVFFDGDGEFAPSFQDPARVLTKINLIQKGPDSFKRYMSKLGCFLVTDGNSPFLGQYCRKVLSLFPDGREILRQLEGRDRNELVLSELFDQWILVESKARVTDAWPNDGFPGNCQAVYADLLGITLADLQKAMLKVTEAKTVDDLKHIISLPPPPLHERFVYKDFAFSYGQAIKYDDNRKTGKAKQSELDSIRRVAKKVLGSDKTREAFRFKDVKSKDVKADGAPTGSGAPSTTKGIHQNANSRSTRPKAQAEKGAQNARPTAASSKSRP